MRDLGPETGLCIDDDERIEWLRLTRSRRVGPATFTRLMSEFGSVHAAIDALPGIAAEAGVDNYLPFERSAAEREIAEGHRIGARLLCRGEAEYPALLDDVADAPPVIWAHGDIALAARPAVAMVGARNASSLGQRMARKLADEVGKLGYVVVSGLARGIDGAAHMAALDTGTIAVMAGGVDVVYPPEHIDLAATIAAKGLLLSEMPIGARPHARHFPRRNRIISGLSLGVVIVEGALKSGSLITAGDALDQGREVMAVPGHPFDGRAAGCNALIRDGARLVRSGADIDEVLAARMKAAELPGDAPAETISPSEEDAACALLSLLSPSPIDEDSVIRQSGLTTSVALQTMTLLEIDGRIERLPGGMVALMAG